MILKPHGIIKPIKGHWATRGLVGFWGMMPFEAGGGQVFDLSGNGHTGDFLGTAPSWGAGKFGPAPKFAGAEYIEITLKNKPTTWTFGGWMRIKDKTADHAFGCLKDSSNSSQLWFDENVDSDRFASGIHDGDWKLVYGTTNPIVGEYYFVLQVYDGSYNHLYVNGIEEGTPIAVGDAIWDTSIINIGRYISGITPGKFHDDIIDLAFIYNRALSSSEIALLYREPFCMFERDPIELWSAATGAAGEVLSANVYDSITVTESITPQLPLLLADISDSVTVNESITPLMPLLIADVYDEITVDESLTTLLPLLESTLFDSVITSEIITPLMPLYQANISEETKVIEDITPSLAGLDTLSVNVSETVNVADILQSQLPLYEVKEYETVSVSEYRNIVLGSPVESVLVSDSIKTADQANGLLHLFEVSISETINTKDVLSPYMIISQYALMMGANF